MNAHICTQWRFILAILWNSFHDRNVLCSMSSYNFFMTANFPLQLRWFLRAKGHRNTLALNVTEVSFMFLFGAMRFGLGSVLLYIYLRNPRTDFLGRLAACIIYGISLMFWVSICSYARHRIFKTTTSGHLSAKNGSASRKELKKKIWRDARRWKIQFGNAGVIERTVHNLSRILWAYPFLCMCWLWWLRFL